MAGEDLIEGDDGGTNDTSGAKGKGKKHKPLSKGQKIGVAIGAITIILVIYQIQKSQSASSSSTTSTSAPIDPQTGYPTGSAEDQAALAQIAASQSSGLSGSGSDGGGGYYSGGSSTDSGIDPATGQSYSSELSTIGSEYTTLGNEYNSLQTEFSTWTSSPPPPSTTPPTTTPPTTTPPTGTPTATVVKGVAGGATGPSQSSAQNLANLNATLKRDEQGNTAGDKASVATLKKQIAAVQSRS